MAVRKCISCGAELGEQEKYCGNCGTVAPDGAAKNEEIELKHVTKDTKNQFEWGWHKVYCHFIIIVQSVLLIVSALMGFVQISRISDSYPSYVLYDSAIQAVIRCVYVFGTINIIEGILGFVTRHMLVNYHSLAIKFLLIFTGLTVVMPIISWCVTLAIRPITGSVLDIIKSAIVPAVLMFTNMVYYLKRIDFYEE